MTRRSLATRRADGSSGLRPNVLGYVDFNGNVGEYLRTTRTALTTAVTTLEFAVRVKLDALGVTSRLAGWSVVGTSFYVDGNNHPVIMVTGTGGVAIGNTPAPGVIPAAATTQPIWIRGQVTTATAACSYWYSLDTTEDYDQVTWTSLGAPATGSNAGVGVPLVNTSVVLAGDDVSFSVAMAGNMYTFYELVNGIKTAWFLNSDIADPPARTFASAGAGQVWTMATGMTPNQFVPSQSFQGGLRNDFSFDLTATGMVADQLIGVVDIGYTTVRVSYQPALIPNHPTLGPFKEAMVVRSTAGFPATNLDGTMIMRHLSIDPVLNRGFASVLDKELNPQQWYYYSLFARYDNTSGWFKVGEQAWLNPGEYGYAQRFWEGFPDYYRRVDSGGWVYPGVLRRLCDVFGYEFDAHRTWTATVGDVWDFEKLSAKLLPEAGAALGLPQESANGDRRMRTLVGNLMALRKQKGTANATEGYVGALTGYPTRVYEGLNQFHRIQHTEWTNAFSAGTQAGSATVDNHPGWSSFHSAITYGQVSRQIAVSGEGSPVGMADGSFYLRNTNNTGAASYMTLVYGPDGNSWHTYVPVIAGHQYRLSTAMKCSSSVATTAAFEWLDETGTQIGAQVVTGMGTVGATWVRVICPTVNAPANAKFVRFFIYTASMANGSHINIYKPMFVDVAWRPEGIPSLWNTAPLSSTNAGDIGTYVHQDYYEPPREVKVNVYPMRTNLALNSDFTLNDLPSGAWSTFDAPTYGQLPIAYSDYADIIDAEPLDSEVDYADMAAGLAPLTGVPPTLIWDTAGGRLHINKTTAPYAWTLMHTYFPATDLGGMSAAIGAYSSIVPANDPNPYLSPTVGTVTTPDPGPPPNQCVFIFKVRGPHTNEGPLVGQYEGEPINSWIVMWGGGTDPLIYRTPTGLYANQTALGSHQVLASPPLDDQLAFSLDIGTNTQVQAFAWNGTSWVPGTQTTGPTTAMLDTASVMRIGSYQGGAAWGGRIYSVELRTGTEPSGDRYLNPTVGTVTTPDPGPLPTRCVFVFKELQTTSPTDAAIVSQDVGATNQRSWVLSRVSFSAPDTWALSSFADGTGAGYRIDTTTTGGATPVSSDETYAISFDQFTSSGLLRSATYRLSGSWAQVGGATTGAPLALFDSSAPLQIGGHYSVPPGTAWPGRIYSVELRTGLDPTGVAVAGATMEFPGINGNNLSTPHTAPFAITNDIDIVTRIRPSTLTPDDYGTVIAQWGPTAYSYGLFMNIANSQPTFGYTLPSGATTTGSPMPPYPAGTMYWLRVTRVAATGTITFYHAPDQATMPTTWTLFGLVTPPGQVDLLVPASTSPMMVGGSGFGQVFEGRIARTMVCNGIGAVTKRIVFPNVKENYLTAPASVPAAVAVPVEIIARVSLPDWDNPVVFPGEVGGITLATGTGGIRFATGRTITTYFVQLPGPTFPGVSWIYPAGTFQPNQLVWLRGRATAAGVYSVDYSTADSLDPPTTWTTGTSTSGVVPNFQSSSSVWLGRDSGSLNAYAPKGMRLARSVVKVNSATVFDVWESNAVIGQSTFTATSGQTVTVMQNQASTFAFPGTTLSGNYLSVPNSAPLQVTGNIEIVGRIMSRNWVPGLQQALLGKPGSYLFGTNTTPNLTAVLYFTDAPSTAIFVTSSSHSFVDGTPYWIKMTRVQSTGLTSFYWAADSREEPSSWTALGTATVGAGKTIVTNTNALLIGTIDTTGGWRFNGRIYRAIVRNAVGGTVVLDVDRENANVGVSSFTATTGGTVTVNQSAGNKVVQGDPLSLYPIIQGPVLDVDDAVIPNDTVTTFPARTGQTMTVNQTTGQKVLRPVASELLWRFDANEAPTDAATTTWTDPRNRVWTATNAQAISGRTLWKFDAKDYPGGGTSYVDPRGKTWTLTNDNAIVGKRSGTKMTLAMEWYTAIGTRILDARGQPLRSASPEYVLGTSEGRYELVNAQPPPEALYGRLLVMASNIAPHDTSLVWALIEDAPYPEGYFNGTYNDGEDGDFFFAVGKGYVGDASPHQSPSVYYQRFRRFASGVSGADALTQLMPRLLPFRRSFKVITAATGLYNVPT